jgi:thiol-disulfide isomerase/thioredoxin
MRVGHGTWRYHPSLVVLVIAWSTLIVLAVSFPGNPACPGCAAAAQAAAWQPTAAPDFTLNDLDGNPRTLASLFRGKPLLLEFMSPDCPHCQEMAPILTRLHAAYAGRVQFVTVAFDRDPTRVQRFAKQEKHGWPYLMGTQQVIDAYRLEGVPTFCFIVPNGRLQNYVVGSMPEKTLREHLDAVLKLR